MEYICGDLLKFLQKRTKICENSAKIIFKQLILGLQYIHKNKIVHRDIKLDNILMDLNNTIKICDFGVSKIINENDIMYDHCGTPAYIAPEIFRDKGYEGFKCDIWSAGVTLYYMISGLQPFKANNIKDLQKLILSGKYHQLNGVSNSLNNLIDGLLQSDPNKRLNINQILNHPWLSGVNVNYRKEVNLFTDAEKILLGKYDVDYLNSCKLDLIENFTDKNLDTINEEKKKMGLTKSLILAPYNSYAEYNGNIINNEIKIENNICKYRGKAQRANLKYELNNNKDFDNGIMKTQKSNDSNMINTSSNNISFSKPISPKFEFQNMFKSNNISERKTNNNIYLNSPKERSLSNDSISQFSHKINIRNDIIKHIEMNVGYDKKYLINCLKNNEINYATATYYLLCKNQE